MQLDINQALFAVVTHGILFGRRELLSYLEAGSYCRWSLESFPNCPVLIRV